MKIGIIGSGMVGTSLAEGFLKQGHEIKIGTRHPTKLNTWFKGKGKQASIGSFSDAAKFGEIIILAAKWTGLGNAISLAGKENFENKIVIDVTNPLDFSKGDSPGILSTPEKSGGAMVQEWLPKSKVVKAFNTINASTMTNPKMEAGTPDFFICGNDDDSKKQVIEIAKKFGWEKIMDLGGINESYWLEALVVLWVRYGAKQNTWKHAFSVLEK
jgi:8-hydroxy-5-deazaflavin:NADPH oxidoreductase